MAFGFLIHKAGWKRIHNCTPFQHGRFAKVTYSNSIVEMEPPLDVFGLCTFNYSKASLNRGFMKSFMTLNIINFADKATRENDGVSWDVRRISSP